jgi:hypothetical protein
MESVEDLMKHMNLMEAEARGIKIGERRRTGACIGENLVPDDRSNLQRSWGELIPLHF